MRRAIELWSRRVDTAQTKLADQTTNEQALARMHSAPNGRARGVQSISVELVRQWAGLEISANAEGEAVSICETLAYEKDHPAQDVRYCPRFCVGGVRS
jgi:hypothetical protein